MSITFEDVIKNFVAGMHELEDGTKSTTGTLRIQGEQLIHYRTPIAERHEECIIVNVTRYSLATGKLQKQLKELVPEDKFISVKGVKEEYKNSLADFLPEGVK